ncbi:ABC transporter substrate-binding protein [Salirhabdus salicampi]|uniref:ABC transporter substrate-binding protein n=1 Tax=Salirhabdus salicampi TaxID=476102 RepID=UPI0020C1F850|nr:ABC transporter substrate-binding protein [Salirhabdus salicampi]MCP8615713.1 ABC transporter substrate-binding protein [Salirhabdus salicampi]
MFLKKTKTLLFTAILLTLTLALVACGSDSDASGKTKETITFGEGDWDSIRVHNAIASAIVEKGFEYETDTMPGSEIVLLTGTAKGDIDVYMEIWTGNFLEQYNDFKDSGDLKEVSVNYDDTAEGLYVPTYVIEGDPERGIEPMAPDLKSVKDLPKYWELFEDEEDPSKGRIYGSIPGWAADTALATKVESYGLDETFNYFQPGSAASLATSLTTAIEKGEPWVGYYWEPTWIAGKHDLTLLEDTPYNEEDWVNGYETAFPSQRLTVAVNSELEETAPEVTAFLSNYETSAEITNNALAYMQEHDATVEEVAEWFLAEYEDVWTEWVSEDIAEKVKSDL